MVTLSSRVQRGFLIDGKPYVVSLVPAADPMIEIRQLRSHAGLKVTIRELYTILAIRAADAAVEDRRARRGRRRRGSSL